MRGKRQLQIAPDDVPKLPGGEVRVEVKKALTSHQTHYKSYRGQVFTGQMTQPTVSKH